LSCSMPGVGRGHTFGPDNRAVIRQRILLCRFCTTCMIRNTVH
jgi:hypothetical protein